MGIFYFLFIGEVPKVQIASVIDLMLSQLTNYAALSEIKSKSTDLKGQAVLSTVPSGKAQYYSFDLH